MIRLPQTVDFLPEFVPQRVGFEYLYVGTVLQNLHLDFSKVSHREGEFDASIRQGPDGLCRMPYLLADPPGAKRIEAQGYRDRRCPLENAESGFQLMCPLFARPDIERFAKYVQFFDPRKIEFAPLIAQPAVGDQYPGGHVVLEMMRFDDAAGMFTRFGGQVFDLYRPMFDQRLDSLLKNPFRCRAISVPGRRKRFYHALLAHSKGCSRLPELSREAPERLADESSGFREQTPGDEYGQDFFLGSWQMRKFEVLFGVVVAFVRRMIGDGCAQAIPEIRDIPLCGFA